MQRFVESLLGVLVVAAVVAGLYNVLADNHEVVRMASDLACADEGASCRVAGMYMERSPIAQTFTFGTRKRGVVRVRCTREYILAGTYACTLSDADVRLGAPPSSGAARTAAPVAPGRSLPAPARSSTPR